MSRPLRRRQLLRGAAGFSLALPFLPSLAPKEAEAQTSGVKRFVAFGTQHGGVWPDAMYPVEASLTESTDYAHAIRRGALSANVSNGRAALSPVLEASSGVLTPELVQKMNVLRGLDITFYISHHRRGHLGNFADNDNEVLSFADVPTIDQIMAWSESFYGDLSTILERSLSIGQFDSLSSNWTNPMSQAGEVQDITPQMDSLALFNAIFVPDEEPEETRPPIADRVLADYNRLRQSNRRLSSADRARLDAHLEMIDELERKLNVAVSCGDIMVPTTSTHDIEGQSDFHINPGAQAAYWQLFNDVIVAAFACDTSRIATLMVQTNHNDYSGDWHQEIAHQARYPGWPVDGINAPPPNGPHPKDFIHGHTQRFFEDVFMDLVTKLDALDDGLGGTVLDSCLVQWTQESGSNTHDPIELPVVTAGSAAGFFRTGQYCDYRNLNSPAIVAADSGGEHGFDNHTGLIYNQYLGSVLQGMGLSPSEYETDGNGGYGALVMSPPDESWYAGYNKYGNDVVSRMGEVLPFLQA